jgi:alanine-glyoxylate transaminase/serine-glyoxylate transaminase/serine-pyruvate transaminase
MVEAIRAERPKIVALVHAETSTGVLQPVEAVARAAKEEGALFVLDCVTSLGGCPVEIDRWGVDLAYSGSQKCLGAPPGLSPVTVSERALETIGKRRGRVPSFYLDLELLSRYWGEERAYHHTAPILMDFALYEALREVHEESLPARFARHRRHHEALCSGFEALGLSLASQEGHRLPMLNAVRVPQGIDEAAVRRKLLEEDGIEIGAGLGPFKGKVWRVGLMGSSCIEENVLAFLGALEKALGSRTRTGADAASAYYAAHPV